MNTEVEWPEMEPWPEDWGSMAADDSRWDELRQDHWEKSHAWTRSLKQGDIVHYHHGHGTWARCEVVDHPFHRPGTISPDPTLPSLVPIALVGPQWARDHQCTQDYWTERVRHGKSFQPHASNIYESPYWISFMPDRPKFGDPTTMETWTQ
jgi:hypothetical protein